MINGLSTQILKKFLGSNSFTTSLPIIAELIKDFADLEYLNSLKRIKYIGNICLVLELTESLSDITG